MSCVHVCNGDTDRHCFPDWVSSIMPAVKGSEASGYRQRRPRNWKPNVHTIGSSVRALLNSEADEVTMKGDVWVIEVKPVTDPLTRHGHKARDVDVRIALALKALLHGYGLRCTVIRDPQPGRCDHGGVVSPDHQQRGSNRQARGQGGIDRQALEARSSGCVSAADSRCTTAARHAWRSRARPLVRVHELRGRHGDPVEVELRRRRYPSCAGVPRLQLFTSQ